MMMRAIAFAVGLILVWASPSAAQEAVVRPLTPEEAELVEDAIATLDGVEGFEKIVECVRKLLNADPPQIIALEGDATEDGGTIRDDSYKCKEDVILIHTRHLDGEFWDCWTLAAVLAHEADHARHRIRHETEPSRVKDRSEKYAYSRELQAHAALISMVQAQLATAPPGVRELLMITLIKLQVMQGEAMAAVQRACDRLDSAQTLKHLIGGGYVYSENSKLMLSISWERNYLLVIDTETGEELQTPFKKIERPLEMRLARRGGNMALYVVGTRANDSVGVVEVIPAIFASHGHAQPHVLEQLPGRQTSSIAIDEATDRVYVWDAPAKEIVLLAKPQPVVVASAAQFPELVRVENIEFGWVSTGDTATLYADELAWFEDSFEDASPLYRLNDVNGDRFIDTVSSTTYRQAFPRAPTFWLSPQAGEMSALINAPFGAQVVLFSVSTNQPLGQLTMPFRQPAVMQLQAPLQLGQQVILIDTTNNLSSAQVQVANQFAEAFDTDAEIIEADGLIHIVEVMGRNLPNDVFALVEGQFTQSIWVSPTRVLVFAPAQPGQTPR